MSTTDEAAPLGVADAAPLADATDTATRATGATTATSRADATASSSSAALSPAVRRLVRQFDLDITGIHGTGPGGRIRVGDVMGLLGGRTDTGNRDAPARALAEDDDVEVAENDTADAAPAPATSTAPQFAIPTSTVFDCDLSRVLSHRKKLRVDHVELLVTSYFLTALSAALDTAREITAGEPPRFGVSLTTVDGESRSSFLAAANAPADTTLDERVRAADAALRTNLDADVAAANLLVHHYGESGSLVATPTPIGAGHAASVGIGRVRREIVVRTVDGVESPRIAAHCYVSLSFFVERVSLPHANRFMAQVVRVLEHWPE
jgi:pyruvate/2-oxoglutarate dehydrogenase complex dihydrolipoamide acyltransferase (E2) component